MHLNTKGAQYTKTYMYLWNNRILSSKGIHSTQCFTPSTVKRFIYRLIVILFMFNWIKRYSIGSAVISAGHKNFDQNSFRVNSHQPWILCVATEFWIFSNVIDRLTKKFPIALSDYFTGAEHWIEQNKGEMSFKVWHDCYWFFLL